MRWPENIPTVDDGTFESSDGQPVSDAGLHWRMTAMQHCHVLTPTPTDPCWHGDVHPLVMIDLVSEHQSPPTQRSEMAEYGAIAGIKQSSTFP